ncbi:type II toxin-antitoxin system VapC family toxin [Pseudonocardia eucalypti]|uniref:Ribonuclease VapC n=1 Tax=Pseudonocardia eucalypti TaxID=648755 RepID=A0ABP9QS52_9PSEU
MVVDCSALIDALSGLDGTDELRELLMAAELHAPTLLDVEVVSTLRRFTLAGQLSVGRAQDLLTDYEDLPLRRWAFDDGFRRRAFSLRHAISAYDAAYVALAEALDCPLVTRDTRLAHSDGHNADIILR